MNKPASKLLLAALLALAAAASAAQTGDIKAALEQEFRRAQTRPPEKVRWMEIDQPQAALTALRRNLTIQSAQLNQDLSAAAYQQARALFDPLLVQTLAHNRSMVHPRTENDLEFKKAIECVSGVCTSTLANNPAVFSLTFDEGRPAGYFPTDIEASTPSATGHDNASSYTAQVNKTFSKGIAAFAADTVTYKDKKFVEEVGQTFVGSYNRPWTNQFSVGVSVPLPGSRFFGDYAAADVALRVADMGQQAAFWQIAGLINTTLLQVEQGYWRLVLAKKIYEVTAGTRVRARALAERTERLFRTQEATRYDRAKVDAQLANLGRQELEALDRYLAASNALASLLDLDKDTVLLPASSDAAIAATSTLELAPALEQGEARNPSIRLAEANRAIATQLHEQSRVQLRPDLSASVSFSWRQSNAVFGYRTPERALQNFASPDASSQSYTLAYTRPWGNRAAQANHQQAQARLRQQEIALEQARRGVASQIALAVADLQSAQQRAEIAKRARDLAESVVTRGERQRSAGGVSEFEITVKQIELLNADLDYQAALLGRKISEAAVHAAIGSLAQRYGEGSAR